MRGSGERELNGMGREAWDGETEAGSFGARAGRGRISRLLVYRALSLPPPNPCKTRVARPGWGREGWDGGRWYCWCLRGLTPPHGPGWGAHGAPARPSPCPQRSPGGRGGVSVNPRTLRPGAGPGGGAGR